MGELRRVGSELTRTIEPELVVGRAPSCGLRLPERYVSAQHALLRWGEAGWELKDLGSLNGTYLNGARVEAGREYRLTPRSLIAFGRSEQEWEVIDAAPPSVMAIPADGGRVVQLDGDMLALPSSDDPQVSIYRNAEGSWVLEQPDAVQPVTNQQTFEVGGVMWRFCCTEQLFKTSVSDLRHDVELRQLTLIFTVSRDEEYVELRAQCAGTTFELGSRGHNYLLLTLARQRLTDAAQGLPEDSCGWVYLEDLAHDPSLAPPHLNVEVYRLRKHMARMGIIDGAKIVERRPRTKQIRIGSGALRINVS